MLPLVESALEPESCDAVGRAPDSPGLVVGNENGVSDAMGSPDHGCSSGGDEGWG